MFTVNVMYSVLFQLDDLNGFKRINVLGVKEDGTPPDVTYWLKRITNE